MASANLVNPERVLVPPEDLSDHHLLPGSGKRSEHVNLLQEMAHLPVGVS